MTQEDKDLLLKDLCARLPYHCRVFYEYVDDLDNKTYGYSLTLNTWCIDEFNADKAVVKPYLRPMSSMTEEEKEELLSLMKEETKEMIELMRNDNFGVLKGKYHFNCLKELNWLLKNHFDFKGLIPKGLAIAVTEENNPYEN